MPFLKPPCNHCIIIYDFIRSKTAFCENIFPKLTVTLLGTQPYVTRAQESRSNLSFPEYFPLEIPVAHSPLECWLAFGLFDLSCRSRNYMEMVSFYVIVQFVSVSTEPQLFLKPQDRYFSAKLSLVTARYTSHFGASFLDLTSVFRIFHWFQVLCRRLTTQ